MNYQNTSDEELMLDYKKGDQTAFGILLQRHRNGVYNFLYRYLGHNENVEEAFQEVFVRVINSADSYTPKAKFSTWVYTIARNFCIDLSRKGRIRNISSLEDQKGDPEGRNWEEKLAKEETGPDGLVGYKDLTAKLEIALQRINPDQREVFLMREKMGLPFDEIAEVVGTSINTVKSRMRYAVSALQEECKKLGIDA